MKHLPQGPTAHFPNGLICQTCTAFNKLSGSAQTPSFGAVKEFLYTLWLFTESDFATFVIPNTAFGVFGALSGRLFVTRDSFTPDAMDLMSRLPFILVFNWSNLLIFDISNQRKKQSIVEDLKNKPWRPLPTGRINQDQTRRLVLTAIPLVLMINALLGVLEETALILCLTWLYNDLKGGDEHWIIRNAIIAAAFGLYNAGSLKVAFLGGGHISAEGLRWIAVISGVILTTMHIQDLKDQAGDAARGRHTAPLTLGDDSARWTLALPIVAWSVYCPVAWGLDFFGAVSPLALGISIVFRLLRRRGREADRRSWKLWTLWTAVLYSLPLVHSCWVWRSFEGFAPWRSW